MAVVTLLPIASRGVFTSSPVTVPGGAPAALQFVLTGTQFPIDPTLTFDFAIERSPDGVAPFEHYAGSSGSQGGLAGTLGGKFGNEIIDGIPRETVSWDGTAGVFKLICTPNVPFIYGITVEVLPPT